MSWEVLILGRIDVVSFSTAPRTFREGVDSTAGKPGVELRRVSKLQLAQAVFLLSPDGLLLVQERPLVLDLLHALGLLLLLLSHVNDLALLVLCLQGNW